MKALIISDDENFVTNSSSILKENNYDLITYKWLLKAIDNIEEIQPDLIVLSSSEYPRHWKTLVQFVKSGIGGDSVKIYLYEPNPLSSEDQEKAKILGINGFFTSTDELPSILENNSQEDIPQVDSIISESSFNEIPVPENLEIEIQKTRGPLTGHILLTNPLNDSFITGKVFEFENNTLKCTTDFPLSLHTGVIFTKSSFIWNNEVKAFEASLISIDDKNIELKVNKYYEEI